MSKAKSRSDLQKELRGLQNELDAADTTHAHLRACSAELERKLHDALQRLDASQKTIGVSANQVTALTHALLSERQELIGLLHRVDMKLRIMGVDPSTGVAVK